MPAFLSVVSGWTGGDMGGTNKVDFSPLTLLAVLLAIVLGIVLAPAVIHLEIQSARGKKVDVVDALRVGLKYVIRFIGLMLLVIMLVLGGLILLIVPGLIMIRRYFLAPYYLIDQDLAISEAMRRSADSSKSYSGYVWGIIGVNVLLLIPGFIPFFGTLASTLLTTLYSVAPAIRYDEIRKLATNSK